MTARDLGHTLTAIQLGYELLPESPAAPHVARLPDLAGPIEASIPVRLQTNGTERHPQSEERGPAGRAPRQEPPEHVPHYVAALQGAADAPFAVPCAKVDNERPVAHAGGPIYTTQAGVPVTLDGGASSDAEGSPLTYTWDFGDGETGTGAAPEHTYASPGRYMLTLIVNDGTADSADWVGTRSFAMVEVTEPTDEPAPPGAVPAASAGDGGGCGCTTSRSPTPLGLGIGMALLLLARSRRRRIALP